MIVFDLVYNLSLLVALSILSGFLDSRFKRTTLIGKVLQGILFGGTAVIGMMYPFVLEEGIIFDGRSIVISLATLFFGPVTGGISSIMGIIYRLYLGGTGNVTGSLLIVLSFLIGYLFYLNVIKNGQKYINNLTLYLFGLLVHVGMMLILLTLPSNEIGPVYRTISISVIGIFPFATLLIGKILLDQQKSDYFINQLKESEAKYRDLFEAHHDGIMIFCLDSNNTISKIIEVNESIIFMLGYTKNELYEKYISELVLNFNQKEINDRISEIKIDGHAGFETQLIHKSGNLIPVEIRAVNIKYGENNAIMNIVRDISQRKYALEKLSKSERKFREIFNSSLELMFIHKISGEIIDVNKAVVDRYGYNSKEEILEKSIGVLSGDTGEFTEELAAEFIKKTIDEGPQRFEWLAKAKDGNLFWLEMLLKTTELDGTERILAVGRDITERKQAEKALIENERLSAIGQTASAVAHDINNSLQAIYSNIELCLRDKNLSDQVRNKINTIRTITGDSATRVQILQKFGGNSNQNQFELIDLNEMIMEVVLQSKTLWKDEAQKNGVNINVETYLQELPKVMGNISELRSSFYNLIKNSVEAMPSGGKIIIKTRFDNITIIATVQDTGIGMDEKTKSRIFQPFFTTKGFEQGRGIGMSGVYNIIKDHNGNISVLETEINNGTTIEVLLPPAKKQETIKKEKEAEIINTKSLNLLWVDDDKLIRDVASEMINLLGHNGDVVENGLEALEYLKKKDYDIFITDIGMPIINGWQLSDEVRKMDTKIKIVVLSGWGAEINDEKLRKHKVDAVLAKPFQINQFLELINRLTDKI